MLDQQLNDKNKNMNIDLNSGLNSNPEDHRKKKGKDD